MLVDKQRDIFFEGVAMGQRITAITVDNKLSKITTNMDSAVVKLIINDLKKYINAAMNVTKEMVIDLLSKDNKSK
jgi:hypothetical protein